jgi:hypothetical protein
MEAREHHPEVEVPDGSPSMQATEYSGSPVNIIQSLRSQMEARPSKPLNIVEAP